MTTATVHINGIKLEAVRSIRFDDQTATIEYIPRLDQLTLDTVPQGSIIGLTIHSDMIDQTHQGVIKGVVSSKYDSRSARVTTETVTLSLYSPLRLHSVGVADCTLNTTNSQCIL